MEVILPVETNRQLIPQPNPKTGDADEELIWAVFRKAGPEVLSFIGMSWSLSRCRSARADLHSLFSDSAVVEGPHLMEWNLQSFPGWVPFQSLGGPSAEGTGVPC